MGLRVALSPGGLAGTGCFRQGVKAYPKSARMLTALGAALFAGALYDEAAHRLCEASDLNPGDPEPYTFMGKIEIAAPNPLPCVSQKLEVLSEQARQCAGELLLCDGSLEREWADRPTSDSEPDRDHADQGDQDRSQMRGCLSATRQS